MSREQIVRDTAYAIWEAEGKPDGRSAAHWREAEARVAASIEKAPAPAKPPAKGKVSAAAGEAPAQAKAPAKAGARAAPKKKS